MSSVSTPVSPASSRPFGGWLMGILLLLLLSPVGHRVSAATLHVCRTAAKNVRNGQLIINAPTTRPSLVSIQHCILPKGVEIKIRIPITDLADDDGVVILVRDVIMEGGSLVIEPMLSTSSSLEGQQNTTGGAVGLLHNVHLDVEDMVMSATGDVLVLDASSDSVSSLGLQCIMSSISINIRHSTITSTTGNIASLMTPPISNVAAVKDISIHIGTNTTMTTGGQLIGCVTGNDLKNVSLVLNSSPTAVSPSKTYEGVSNDECRGGGPVTLAATSKENYETGLLNWFDRGEKALSINSQELQFPSYSYLDH